MRPERPSRTIRVLAGLVTVSGVAALAGAAYCVYAFVTESGGGEEDGLIGFLIFYAVALLLWGGCALAFSLPVLLARRHPALRYAMGLVSGLWLTLSAFAGAIFAPVLGLLALPALVLAVLSVRGLIRQPSAHAAPRGPAGPAATSR